LNQSTEPNSAKYFIGKPERKRPLGRPKYRWEDNIIMDLKEMACKDMARINLAQERKKWRALNECGNEIWGSTEAENLLTCCATVSFS
jgi:hypothetical protein